MERSNFCDWPILSALSSCASFRSEGARGGWWWEEGGGEGGGIYLALCTAHCVPNGFYYVMTYSVPFPYIALLLFSSLLPFPSRRTNHNWRVVADVCAKRRRQCRRTPPSTFLNKRNAPFPYDRKRKERRPPRPTHPPTDRKKLWRPFCLSRA